MFLKKKKRIIELINTICEFINYISESGNTSFIEELKLAFESLNNAIENSKNDEAEIDSILKKIGQVYDFLNSLNLEEVTYQDLENVMVQVGEIETEFLDKIKVKLNIAILPYNITMWDSLESIYNAAKEDEDCVVTVVPIPYYDISEEEPIMKYDGAKFAQIVDITHFQEYNLSIEEPDIIYIHNIYDDGNILTSVHPDFYTTNLKKYTDMLVYSPYCTPSFLKKTEEHSFTFDLAGAENIDRFVCAGDFVKKQGIARSIDKEKILNLGTPKFDALVNKIEDVHVPQEWIEKANGRRIVLVPTSISYFIGNNVVDKNSITNAFVKISVFSKLLATFKINDIFVIWRPHPLTREFIKKRKPFLLEWFEFYCKYIENSNEIVLDTYETYLPAFKLSDALYTDSTSLIFPYLMLNKKLILSGSDKRFKELNIPYDKKKIDFEHNFDVDPVKKIVDFEKVSELKIDDSFLNYFYKNLDGTSGEKIHRAIKNDVFKNNTKI